MIHKLASSELRDVEVVGVHSERAMGTAERRRRCDRTRMKLHW